MSSRVCSTVYQRKNGYVSRFSKKYVLDFYLNSADVCDIMNIILSKHCKLNVIGYNKSEDEYWGKQIKQNYCDLYFKLSVKNTGENNCSVIIIPTVGTEKKINELCKSITDVIRVCEFLQ